MLTVVTQKIEAMHSNVCDQLKSLASANKLAPEIAIVLAEQMKELVGLLAAAHAKRNDSHVLDKVLDALGRIGGTILRMTMLS
jgi:hypothetical protein